MLIIGHRGCYFEGFNQNTLRSFKKVISLGASAIEFDVQKTADDALIIAHNLDLEDVSTGKGLISDLPLSYIQSLYAGDTARGKDRIPQLEDLLALVASYPSGKRPCLHLELKGKDSGKLSAQKVQAYLADGRLQKEDFLVSSFIWDELTDFLSQCPDIAIALLAGAIARAELLAKLPAIEDDLHKVFAYSKEAYMLPRAKTIEENIQQIKKHFSDPHIQDCLEDYVRKAFNGYYYNDELVQSAIDYKAFSLNLWFVPLSKEFIEKAHAQNIKVFAYTINDPKDIKYYTSLGLDGFFTDFYDENLV